MTGRIAADEGAQPTATHERRAAERVALACALCVLGEGVAVLLAWAFDIDSLKRVLPGQVTMKTNTALGFAMLGSGLTWLLWGRGRRCYPWAGRLLGAATLLLGAATASQFIFGVDLGIDQMLFKELDSAIKTSSPNRMAPNSAAGQVLAGAMLLLLSWPQNRRAADAAVACAGLLGAIGLCAQFGYANELEAAYGWGNWTRMAIHTAAGFGLYSLGGVAAAWSRSEDSFKALRSWAPFFVFILLGAVTICLWLVLSADRREKLDDLTVNARDAIRTEIERDIESLINSLNRMALRQSSDTGRNRERWEADARLYQRDLTGLESVNRVRTNLQPIWSYPPSAGARLGSDGPVGRLRKHIPVEQPTLVNVAGDDFCLVPMDLAGGLREYLLVELDLHGFLQKSLISVAPGFGMTLLVNRRETYLRDTGHRAPPAATQFPLFGQTAELSVRAGPIFVASQHTKVPEVALLCGAALSLLSALLARLGFIIVGAERARGQELTRLVDEQTAELKRTNRELEAFAYSVSHDLRSPLRAMEGYAAVLQEDYSDKLDKEGGRYLNIIRDEATRMDELIQALLRFAEIQRFKLKRTTVDMTQLARETFDLQMDGLAEKDADRTIRLDLLPLPTARGDRALLGQVFANLIANAIKFTRGSDPAVVTITGRQKEKRVEYEVKDNGVGFSAEFAANLFGVFKRLHGEEEFEGHGIGLALARRIVERHRGTIRAESHPGQGAAFVFDLPSKSGKARSRRQPGS